MEPKIGCVIMASGLGKRFGGNKLLCDFRGKPMIRYILDSTADIYPRIVVTRHADIAALCRERHIPVLLHDLPLRSDTVRLGLSALLEAEPALDGCLFAAADQPCLKKESIAALCDAFNADKSKIHRLHYQGTPGNPVLFPRCCFEKLLRLPEGKGGNVIIKAHPELVRCVEATAASELIDIDTPEILAELAK